jgi:lysozyme
MSRAKLTASKALWLTRERYRFAKWRRYHRKGNKALSGKWWRLYDDAHDMRMRREHQLAALVDKPRTISERGIDLIASFEGFVPHPYDDPVGYATVGYGHLLHKSRVTDADRRHWGTLTPEQGKALLRKDVARFEKAVRRLVKTRITQGQFDALVSFAYNVGEGALAGSTLLRRLNAGDKHGAADEFLKWDVAGGQHLPGLARRRRAERDRFMA